jgi:hypothetical protein
MIRERRNVCERKLIRSTDAIFLDGRVRSSGNHLEILRIESTIQVYIQGWLTGQQLSLYYDFVKEGVCVADKPRFEKIGEPDFSVSKT